MRDEDLRMMLLRTRSEIVRLRERLKIAEPKAQAYDALIRVLDLTRTEHMGYEEDMVQKLTNELEAVEARIKEAEAARQTQVAPPPSGREDDIPI